MLGRLQGRQLAVLPLERFADRAGRPLADARTAAPFQEAAEAHQMEGVRSRATFLGMLQAKGVHRQEVNSSEGGVRVFARTDFVKDSPATLQAVWHESTAHRTDA